MLFWRQMFRSRVAPSAIAALALLAGCYATTPHRPEVKAPAPKSACLAAVDDVFTRAAFVPMQTPAGYTAFFAPRMGSSQLQRRRAGLGVGVVVEAGVAVGGGCRVVLEALSNEGACPEVESLECSSMRSPFESVTLRSCQSDVTTCPMSTAPGAHNDAMVDDLARRLRETLGKDASVTGLNSAT
jgi:hypothetical protein